MDINYEMVNRAVNEMERLLKNHAWSYACDITKFNIAFDILDYVLNGKKD